MKERIGVKRWRLRVLRKSENYPRDIPPPISMMMTAPVLEMTSPVER